MLQGGLSGTNGLIVLTRVVEHADGLKYVKAKTAPLAHKVTKKNVRVIAIHASKQIATYMQHVIIRSAMSEQCANATKDLMEMARHVSHKLLPQVLLMFHI